MKRFLSILEVMVLPFLAFYAVLAFIPHVAFAQTGVVTPQDFLGQVLTFIQSWGGLSMWLKVSGAITLLVASMKVTVFNQWIWSKLGALQVWVAPFLGLVAGLVGLGQTGPISAASVFAYISAGAGAVMLHELLDSVKALPGIGAQWVAIITLVESFLGGPAAQAKKMAKR